MIKTKFDAAIVAKNIKAIIPQENHHRKITNGSFEIKSVWKRGKLTYLELNHEDMTNKLNLEAIQFSIEEVLMTSHKYRREFTGTYWFVLEVANGFIKSIYRKEGSFIIKDSGLTEIWKLN